MSDDSIHRPRRIIPPNAPPPVETPAARALADRFARSLAGTPLRREAMRNARPMKAAESERDPWAKETSLREAPRMPVALPKESSPVPVAAAAPAPVAQVVAKRGADAAEEQPAPAQQRGQPVAAAPVAEEEDWGHDLVKRIVVLCRAADPAFQSWSVSMPLDPLVLPQTTLRLGLSPHRLTLGFRTDSPESLRLISGHSGRLVHLLERAMPMAREIDVDVT